MLTSKGTKRYIASLLTIILAITAGIPNLPPELLQLLQSAVGTIGGLGLAHAFIVGNLKGFTAANLTSILAVLVAVAPTIPQLAPYVPIIESLAALLGISAVRRGISSGEEESI